VPSFTKTAIASACFIALAFILSLIIPNLMTPNIWVLLIFPIIEEFVFRAQLQTSLAPINKGLLFSTISRANILTTTAFSLTHALLRDWETGLAVVLPSLFLGWLYEQHRSLLLNICVHCVANIAFFAKYLGY